MRRIYILSISLIAVAIALNVIFFHRVKNGQIRYQKEILLLQAQRCGDHVEKTLGDYESDLNRIIFKHINNIYEIFNDRETMYSIGRDLEGFYAKYRDLITSISIIDDRDKFFGIYINDHDDFVIDTFSRKNLNQPEPRVITRIEGSGYRSFFPYFQEGQLKGNIVVGIDLDKYLQKVFELYKISGLVHQWLMDSEGKIILSNFDKEFELFETERIKDSILNEAQGHFEHAIKFDHRNFRVISAYYPLNLLNNPLGLVFSMNTGHLLDIFIKKYTILSALIFILLSSLVSFLIYHIYRQKKDSGDFNASFTRLKMILENFPVGIMILESQGVIRMINQAGQRMLYLKENEDITGTRFNDQFLVTNQYLLDEGITNGFDKDHFFHYVREGNEIVIYRKDKVIEVDGEELTIAALMDVSPIERSRKQESAANQAKSDFLARMSHEIRNPMNGIIGMSEQLLSDSLSKNSREKIEIIQKSADLLMNIINDILDISKIEAGKMMLEEIPFDIRDELSITTGLFKPLAEEKDLEFTLTIDPEVPHRVIGDPFRLRQVISNLLSNSIKFTSDGFISITMELLEKYKNRMSLLFRIIDTGIGIPKEKFETIFESYEQGEVSTSRNYGGTGLGMAISKQLVELMNGEIWVESPTTPSKNRNFPGASIAFTIEVHSDEKPLKHYDFSGIKRYSQITALILNRKKDETDLIHRVLDGFGINFNYRIYGDEDIDDIIDHIQQSESLYQLIIIKDKPGYDGFGLALRLKENQVSSRYPIILISSGDRRGNYLKCKSLDIDHYLIQPYDTHEIFHILQETFKNIEDTNGILDQVNKIRGDLKILIAEDNLVNQKVMQSLFKHLGYEVELAGNGEEVVTMAGQNNYDVIFMDIYMPEKDGLMATGEIRSSGNKVPIIALTGSDNNEKLEMALKAGMDDFIPKPVRVGALKQLLIKWFSVPIES